MRDKEALTVHDLSVSYQNHDVLKEISFQIPTGLLVGIVGPNGAGKSTLLKAICQMVSKKKGRVLFCGKSFSAFRKKIAFIPQRNSVEWNFPITVFEVVLMGCYPRLSLFRRPSSEEKLKALRIIKEVGLEGFENRSLKELSGGQQQRVFVARALMQEADLFFFDEPFAGIDAASEKTIIHIFRDLKDQGKTLFVVHHDINAWKRYFDWLILLNKKLIAYGPTNTVLTESHINEAYGGSLDFLNANFFK